MTAVISCAIYTRKSSEEGLDQAFNSLHAQREACEAYIKSQRGAGWVALSANYDDGGVSGGTLNRPALQALMADIERRKVDLVVVYKVDRLTRSLNDFAKLVELFDAHGVSFVSVTQQFNTTTSMGRLTLNMLLSFAQFEREVTGERIRDKIAASKRRGLWMGGLPPLGYDVIDRKLVVNEAEAEAVRRLFRLYLEIGNVRLLKDEASRQGLFTKRRVRHGVFYGGIPFSRGNLFQLLRNPLYIGEVAHKGKSYPGQHQAIMERETWDAVQRRLSENAPARHTDKNSKAPSLLTGLVYDETGDMLSPSHANKKGRRYRYYISRRIMHGPDPHGDGWRIPAKELEAAVSQSVIAFLRDEKRVIEALPSDTASPAQIRKVIRNAAEVADELAAPMPYHRRDKLRRFIRRVTLGRIVMCIEFSARGLLGLVLGEPQGKTQEADCPIHLEVPIAFRRRGVESKLIIVSADRPWPNEKLVALIARSHRWMDEFSTGTVGSAREIARRERLDESDVSRFLLLAFLAPEIVEATVAGWQATELTAEALRRACPVPSCWKKQRDILGFPR